MLPVASTRNTPPVGLTLDELAELRMLEDELGTLEAELGMLELERTDELLGMLELERELGITEDDELGRLEPGILEELPQPAVNPKGEGWLAQVVLEIQLLLFSYPQPLVVVTQTG
jgi:hypothetical protein